MQTGPRIAAAIAVGYALGRTRKMKLAITVGGVLAGRRLSTAPGKVLTEGAKRVSSSPQLSSLAGELRGRLVEAATSAATAAASNKIESWGDQLSERAENLRNPPAAETQSQQRDSELDQGDSDQGEAAAVADDDGAAAQEPAAGQKPGQRTRVPKGARGSGSPKQSSRGRVPARSASGSAPRRKRGGDDG